MVCHAPAPSDRSQYRGQRSLSGKARDIILHNHERYDGKGYPAGVKGENIPVGACLMAVADTLDTMTTDRSYRLARSLDSALDELAKRAGAQFYPWR